MYSDEELYAHAAVQKTHTCALDAFRSPETGRIARFTRGFIRWYHDRVVTAEYDRLPVPDPDYHPAVPLVVSVSSVGHPALDEPVAHVDGVVAGTGVGTVTGTLWTADTEAECPVAVVSRCHAGRPTNLVYWMPGDGVTVTDLNGARLANGTPGVARIELALAAATRVPEHFELWAVVLGVLVTRTP